MSDVPEPDDHYEPWTYEVFTTTIPMHGIANRRAWTIVNPHVDNEPLDLRRAVACVNLLAGVRAERLTTADDAVKMFLAHLKGDHFAAAAWADEVQARASLKEGQCLISRSVVDLANKDLGEQLTRYYNLLREVQQAICRDGHYSWLDTKIADAIGSPR